jgi:hypothetical protein
MSGFLNSSIARDDVFIFSGSDLTGSTLLLDVLGNDGGGKAKRLVSIDADRPLDLLPRTRWCRAFPPGNLRPMAA